MAAMAFWGSLSVLPGRLCPFEIPLERAWELLKAHAFFRMG